ncbi:MAG TPA: hypothetical protein VHX88_19315 [Solirubrobacteraceae bacterium]|nr:hypothetical protein [Solirubrobacteraceae bacterium]
MLSFPVSIAALSLLQGALVGGSARPLELPARLRGPLWALIPPGSIVVVILSIQGSQTVARGLTWLALVAVPPLAAAALGWLMPGARPPLALLAAPLLALTWSTPGSLAGEAAGALLSALSCVTLGVLLAAVAPRRWLVIGILAMAVVDVAFVASDLLQHSNDVLDRVAPAAGLPRLQRLDFGDALMGYGDVFIAATLGALLAGRPRRRVATLLAIVLALGFDLLFFAVNELPATVPIALTLLCVEPMTQRRRVATCAARSSPSA